MNDKTKGIIIGAIIILILVGLYFGLSYGYNYTFNKGTIAGANQLVAEQTQTGRIYYIENKSNNLSVTYTNATALCSGIIQNYIKQGLLIVANQSK